MQYFPLFVASRYSQPYLHRGLAGFLGFVSLAGLALAVFALIVVTSIMNGFERELQSRMLTLIPHAQLRLDPEAAGRLPQRVQQLAVVVVLGG